MEIKFACASSGLATVTCTIDGLGRTVLQLTGESNNEDGLPTVGMFAMYPVIDSAPGSSSGSASDLDVRVGQSLFPGRDCTKLFTRRFVVGWWWGVRLMRFMFKLKEFEIRFRRYRFVDDFASPDSESDRCRLDSRRV